MPLPNRIDLGRSYGRTALYAGLALVIASFGLGGCAQSPQQLAASHGKEYFPSSTYGAASRRVVADGEPVPRGGGRYLVGKPYTVAGQTYYPSERIGTQIGYASWYGDAFHGRLTANGEIYDRDGITAASPTLPLPSYVKVTNLRNNYSMIVRVNDRGPYASNRIMDVSRRVAEALDFKRYGTTQLKIDYVGRAGMNGSDDAKLYATLRTNDMSGYANAPTRVAAIASRMSRTQVASITPYVPAPRPIPYEPEKWLSSTRHTGTSAIRPVAVSHWPVRPPVRTAMARPPIFHLSTALRTHREMASNPMPPNRPMDLGTIPGAATPIRAHRDTLPLRLARSRDD